MRPQDRVRSPKEHNWTKLGPDQDQLTLNTITLLSFPWTMLVFWSSSGQLFSPHLWLLLDYLYISFPFPFFLSFFSPQTHKLLTRSLSYMFWVFFNLFVDTQFGFLFKSLTEHPRSKFCIKGPLPDLCSSSVENWDVDVLGTLVESLDDNKRWNFCSFIVE